MFTPKITIIIPIYNTSKYLRKCLDSIIHQTLSHIEIVIINDCSPDPLDHKICIDYEKRDSRITYIQHQTNLGLGGARNSGLRIAKGDYIWFIDSDDFIDINACEFLYKLSKKEHSDVIAFSATSHIDGSLNLAKKKYYYYNRSRSILDQKLSGSEFIDLAILTQSFHVSACLHLFKKELLSHFKFRENVVHEDTDIIPIIIYSADSIFCVKYAPYYRLLREDSITQKIMTEKTLIDKISSVESLLNYLSKQQISADSSLSLYAHYDFHFTKSLYSMLENRSGLVESKFMLLNNKYNNYFQDTLIVGNEPEDIDLNKKYLHLKNELQTIKASRFWRVSKYLRKAKDFW